MEDTRAIFARHQLRCTKQRKDVYEALASCRCHPTAEQLHRMVNDETPGTSLATVYNTLEAFCCAGLCRRIATACGSRYDADVSDHLHIQLNDGSMIDVPEDYGREIMARLPKDVIERLEQEYGVSIDYVSIQLFASDAES